MARLIWSPRSVQDLNDICDYISRDSEFYAKVVSKEIVTEVERIPDHPLAGSIVPEYDKDTIRERFLYNYRIIYRVQEETIEIVTICHGARLLPDGFAK
ncbi:MAG: type II toxin-antitoxin system RelE/ParE family toxin [Planctomycetes bacterium]|nr:type II toxin-antitoxin system RelE/ParE family toxin [Planctomycetota bacterium]